MKRRRGYLLLLACPPALSAPAASTDPFAPLLAETRPLATRWQVDYAGSVELGAGYVGDDSFMAGQYNGLEEQGPVLVGNLDWRQWQGDQLWRVDLADAGLDTRSGVAEWRNGDRYKIRFEMDNLVQVRNDSGLTPYSGHDQLWLPADWTGGITTGEFSRLEESLNGFRRELERHRYGLSFDGELAQGWRVTSSVGLEDKQGTGDIGAGMYIDAATADAVLLPRDVDYRTTTFDLGVGYQGRKLQLDTSYHLADFANDSELLVWQNPYVSGYGEAVDFPAGQGGIALAPDNLYQQLRLAASYQLPKTFRVSLDGSYGRAEQDADLAEYSVNPLLLVEQGLPRSDLGGERDTGMVDLKLTGRPLAKLGMELHYRLEDRDDDLARDGWRYIRGDAMDQPASRFTVYNTAHDTRRQLSGLEFDYRLPWRTKLAVGYEYEDYKRENAAVEQTEQDRYYAILHLQPLERVTSRLELSWADRAADTYYWDQSYYALLDAELINLTPDSQRYINHPLLSQYHLANREGTEAKLDLNYAPSASWQLAFNWRWQDNDFDQSELGLTGQEGNSYNANASYFPGRDTTLTVYASWDDYQYQQTGRAFRGGIEKNAFVVTPPLPQASDPARDWDAQGEDEAAAVGFNLEWLPRERIEITLDYSYVDTTGAQSLASYGGVGMDDADLPDQTSTEHRVVLDGLYHLRDDLSLKLEYRFSRFDQDDWSIDGVAVDTLAKVLTFGETSPDEDIHYIGVSAIYRWR